MMQLSNILFSPLAQTGNAEAITRATALAEHHGARLTLLGVVPEPSRLQLLFQAPEHLQAAMESGIADLEAEFRLWTPDPTEVEREGIVTVGNPAQTIIDHVKEHGHDLVMVSADDDRVNDPVVKRLLQFCPSPVLVAKATQGENVVAAVNPDPDEVELNNSILEHAAALHSVIGGELHVVHAWEFYAEQALRHSAFIHHSEEEVDDIVAGEHREHLEALGSLVSSSSVADAPWTVHLFRGRPDEVITNFVDRHHINALVLGTIARRGLPGLIIGNTADRLLTGVACSILAIKPPWFLSLNRLP